MSNSSLLGIQKKPSATPTHKPVLAPQRRFVLPERTEDKLSAFSTQRSAAAERDFGSTSLGTESAQTCPLATPRTCPFGGACHTCPTRVQAKLVVGQPDDESEREADRVAEQVMRMPEPWQRSVGSNQTSAISRVPSSPTDIEVTPELELQIRSLRGGGRPLTDSERAFFEPRFGHDFSRVRVHTDPVASASAQAINARAYSVGRDIVFALGQLASDTKQGRCLLAHELSHVVQQRGVGDTVQCWGWDDHRAITEDVASKVTKDGVFAYCLSGYAPLMDSNLLSKAIWAVGITRGEGPDHGESYNYDPAIPDAECVALNVSRQRMYMWKAVSFARRQQALQRQGATVAKQGSAADDMFAALGDACHVAQDRGSHGEGIAGRGHSRTDGKNPDSRADNSSGWGDAYDNTRALIREFVRLRATET